MLQAESRHREMTSFMRIAWQCACLPLVAGVSVFLLWWMTRWQLLMFLGGVVIAGGCLFALVCFWAVSSDWIEERRSERPKAIGSTRGRILCIFVMLANFPIALWMVEEGMGYHYSYPVTVINASPHAMTNLVVGPGSKDCSLEELLPGASADFRQYDVREGSFGLQAQLQGQPLDIVVDSYAIPYMVHERATITVRGHNDIEGQEEP